MGVNESEIAAKGKHSHSYGYEPKFLVDDENEKITARFDTGNTQLSDGPGTYKNYIASVGNFMKGGKFGVVLGHSTFKNNHENDSVRDRLLIDYETFDTYEQAKKRLFDYLGLNSK